ncbi:type II secretion system protein [Massilia phyllosphaerae]|uniref:type II secretion system protein n=1 Tax=Massilia phyllosphaerae TaxID=3106034 RepID=UPI002B1CCDA4|nr:type II secretion system protein [Massilia sp. SGZ-792]
MMKTPILRRGFTLLEFAVTLLVAATVSTLLLNRFEFYREQAELAATRQLVGVLRTALHARASQLQAAGQTERLRALADDNPMNLLAQKPANYLGEFVAVDPGKIGRSGWVFDARDKSIVYLLPNAESFSFGTARLLRFKVEFFRAPEQRYVGLALNQVSG